jgi:hypothetical protein
MANNSDFVRKYTCVGLTKDFVFVYMEKAPHSSKGKVTNTARLQHAQGV